MTTPEPKKGRRLTWLWVALAFFIGLVAMAGIAFLRPISRPTRTKRLSTRSRPFRSRRTSLTRRCGARTSREYDSFKKTANPRVETPYGGSNSYDKLAKYPILKRVWAGYAFSKDFNEERGHFYRLTDQKETKRQEVVAQPAACASCHARRRRSSSRRWAR